MLILLRASVKKQSEIIENHWNRLVLIDLREKHLKALRFQCFPLLLTCFWRMPSAKSTFCKFIDFFVFFPEIFWPVADTWLVGWLDGWLHGCLAVRLCRGEFGMRLDRFRDWIAFDIAGVWHLACSVDVSFKVKKASKVDRYRGACLYVYSFVCVIRCIHVRSYVCRYK